MSQNKARYLLSFALLPGLFSCQQGGVHHMGYAYAFGANWQIHLYEGDHALVNEIIDQVNACSFVLDLDASHCPSGIYALNHESVVEKADPFFLDALALAKEVECSAHGAFSYTIGALTEAWLEAEEAGHALEEDRRTTLLEEAKDTKVQIEGSKVTRLGEGVVDLGAVGKGLCLERIKTLLEERHVTKYLIDAGTSSYLVGENSSADGSVYVHLVDATGKGFKAKSCAISTSSTSRQGATVGGKRYSHIVDPRNGEASLAYDALCLKGIKAGILDAYSTAYLCLGQDYLGELEAQGIQAALMKEGQIVYASQGFLS